MFCLNYRPSAGVYNVAQSKFMLQNDYKVKALAVTFKKCTQTCANCATAVCFGKITIKNKFYL